MKKRLFPFALALALCVGLVIPAEANNLPKAGEEMSMYSTGSCTGIVDQNGSLWVWGYGGGGVLGIGEVEMDYFQSTPRKVMDDVRSFEIGNTSAVVKTDNTLWLCGNRVEVEWYESSGPRYTFTKSMDNVASVSVGGSHAAVIKTDGSLWIWRRSCAG